MGYVSIAELAFEACISGGKSLPMMQKLAAGAMDSLDDPEIEWERVETERKVSIQSFHLFYLVMLPAFVKLIADGVDSVVGMDSVGRIGSTIDSFSESLMQRAEWDRIVKCMSFAFDPGVSRQDIVDELHLLKVDQHSRCNALSRSAG